MSKNEYFFYSILGFFLTFSKFQLLFSMVRFSRNFEFFSLFGDTFGYAILELCNQGRIGPSRIPLVGANDLCAVIRVLKLEETIDGDALQTMIFELVETLSDSILIHSSSSTYSR